MLLTARQGLTAHQLTLLDGTMARRRKSVGVAYGLWFFLGSLGAHAWYLGYAWRALLRLTLNVGGVYIAGFLADASLASPWPTDQDAGHAVGTCTLVISLALWIWDSCRLPRWVAAVNARIEVEAIAEVLSLPQQEGTHAPPER
jgi:hypothetical protein